MGVLDNTKYIFKVCELYYRDGLSQKEISAELGISRPQVSRIIAIANERNLVTVRFNYPNSFEAHYQDLIKAEYGVDAIVFDLGNASGDAELRLLAGKCADYLTIEIKDGYRVGIMSSRTVKYIADNIPVTKKHGFEYVPLCGGYSGNGIDWNANVIAQEMASKSNGRYYVFTAPNFAKNEDAKNVFVAEPSVRQVLDLIPTCDICLVGIGNIDATSTGSLASGLTKEDLEALSSMNAVSSICSSYLDADGNVLRTSLSDRMIGASIKDIQNSKVFGIACGVEKTEAIKAVLKGGVIDVIITSLETAKNIIGKSMV